MADRRVIANRRRTYRPGRVDVLLVGESAPAGGNHYYLANSLLFHAIQEAARRVYGRRVPEGEDFLAFAQGQGIWLVDLAAQPVNDLDELDRRSVVRPGIPRIARVMLARRSGARKEQGGSRDGQPPVPSWHRDEFVDGLARVARRARRRKHGQ